MIKCRVSYRIFLGGSACQDVSLQLQKGKVWSRLPRMRDWHKTRYCQVGYFIRLGIAKWAIS